MRTKIEGMVIKRIPFQERHVIATLMLRNGLSVSALFYGGLGGGKKHKASTLELGYMMQVEISPSKMKTDLYKVKEWNPIWSHEEIRNNYKAFSLLCLYLEIVGELSPQADLSDPHLEVDDIMEGLFRVCSNAVFHLEQRAKEKITDPKTELFIFLTKILIEQGLFPIREGCAFCDIELKSLSTIFLVPDHGGFSCSDCINHLDENSQTNKREGRELWELLGGVANQKYQELMGLKIQDTDALYSLLHYFNYQFHFHENTFKSLKMVL